MAELAGGDAHILVVDDDDRIRTLLKRYLQERGFRVSTAPNAAKALSTLNSLAFDLLVLDVMMPGMNGFELTEAVRKRGRHAHPAAHGSRARPKTVSRVCRWVPTTILAKPFEPERTGPADQCDPAPGRGR